MTLGMSKMREFVVAIIANWLTSMSGAISVPLAISTQFVDPQWAKAS